MLPMLLVSFDLGCFQLKRLGGRLFDGGGAECIIKDGGEALDCRSEASGVSFGEDTGTFSVGRGIKGGTVVLGG